MVVVRLLGPVEAIDDAGTAHRVGSPLLTRHCWRYRGCVPVRWSEQIGCWSRPGQASHPSRGCERCDFTYRGSARNSVGTVVIETRPGGYRWRCQPIRSTC